MILGAYGPFEAMLGLGRQGTQEFSGLFRPGIWFVLRLLRLLGMAPIRMFVAADGRTVVGTTMLLPWPNSGYILGVGVRPSHRRRGLAGRMIERAEQTAARRGRPWAVLDVEAENHPALTLYLARQYAQIQSALWLLCETPGSVTAVPRPPSEVRAVGKSGRKAAAAWCARHVPASVTAVLPPDPARLSHLESLGQFPGAIRETWSVGPSAAPVGFLAGVRRAAGTPGILFLPALDPSATQDDLVRLVQEGTTWLVAQGSATVIAAVPDHVSNTVPWFQELGFVPQMTTLTLARRLEADPSGSRGPKGP